MTKKLLFLIVLLCSVNGFAQATAYPAPDISQCNNEVFNLTLQTPIILGNQSPQEFTVTYFQSQADALANVNPITNPSFFIGVVTQTIYARVDNLSDGSFDITSFQISWSSIYLVPSPDVTVCYSYILPELQAGNYFTEPNGAGTMLSAGFGLTVSQTIYVYLQSGNCADEDSFEVTILPDPLVSLLPDVTACDGYTLPVLPINTTYHSAPDASPLSLIPAGTVITTTSTIYLHYEGELGTNCNADGNFTVTILQSMPQLLPSRISRCTSYQLPALPPEYQYFTGPNATGTTMNAGDVISQSTTVYVHAATTTVPLCTSDWPVSIEIGLPQISPVSYEVLDCEGDGFATFDLESKIPEILAGLADVNITFYETLADAQLGINAIAGPYSNLIPNGVALWVRGENAIDGCYAIFQMELTVADCANLSGVVRIDTDGNGCSESDPPAAGIEVVCTAGNDVFHSYTNAEGEYQFTNVPQGVNIVYVPTGAQLNYGTASPTAHTFNVVGTTDGMQDFCITPAVPVNDASVYILASGTARPGQIAWYLLLVQNNGNTMLDGTATLTYDASMATFLSADTAPSSTSANSLTFNFSALQPYGVRAYWIQFTVAAPPIVNAGSVLNYSASVGTVQPEDNPGNNLSTLGQTVVNSYDPNDISVSSGMFIYYELGQADDELIYTVRFQNTGNADAINVRIEQTLDNNLDWSTFRPIAASHSFASQRWEDHLVFRFDGIHLPAESENEPGSHGFVTYAIKPLLPQYSGDVMSATADIYFDFNEPITTNTVNTQLLNLLGVDENSLDDAALYPNPAHGQVAIHFANAAGEVSIRMIDVQGKLILEQNTPMNSNEALLDISKVGAGLYFVKVEADGKSVIKKLVVK